MREDGSKRWPVIICVQVLKSEDRGKNSDNRKAIRIRSNPHDLDLPGTRDALTSGGKVPDLANSHKELCYLTELEVQRKGTTWSATPQGQPQVSAAVCSDILETDSISKQLSQEPMVAGGALARKLTGCAEETLHSCRFRGEKLSGVGVDAISGSG